MKSLITIFIFIAITGCTIVGSEIGEEIDEIMGSGGDEYETMLAEEGLETDIEILKSIINNLGKEEVAEEVTDNIACAEPPSRQICTALKGCWCESM